VAAKLISVRRFPMTIVTIVGMVAGAVLILTAVAVFWSRKDFPTGGVMVTLVGLIFIGMSQWSTIRLTTAGTTVELLKNELQQTRDELQQTAAAVDTVAAQAQQAAAAVEETNQQIVNFADLLEERRVLSADAVEPIRAELEGVPKINLRELDTARETLQGVMNK
jgi:hypothetical protein